MGSTTSTAHRFEICRALHLQPSIAKLASARNKADICYLFFRDISEIREFREVIFEFPKFPKLFKLSIYAVLH